MKKFILIGCFILLTTTTHAADKWTGPTSPIDPMWGMTGSSIMSEALRDNQSSYQQQKQIQDRERRIREFETQINILKEKQKSNSSISIWDD